MTFASFKDRLLPIALSQGAGLACGVLGVKLTTHWIAPDDYGRYGVFLTLASLGMWVVHAGLAKGVNRLWAGSADPRGLLRECRTAMGGRRAFWFLLLTLGLTALADPAEWPRHWPLVAGSAFALSILAILQGALQAKRSHWADFSVTATGSATRSFLPPLAYVLGSGSATLMRAGFLVHGLITSVVAWFWIRRQLRERPTEPGPRQLDEAYLGHWFLALSLAHWVLNGLNRWIASGFFDATFAGHFTLGSNIAMIPTSMFGVIVVQYFQPGLYSLSHDTVEGRRAMARRVDLIALGYTATALAGLAAMRWLAPHCVGIIIDETYLPSLPLIFAAGCFIIAIMQMNLFQLLLLATRRETRCGPVELATSGLLIGLCLMGAWMAGERGFLLALYLSPAVPWIVTRFGMQRLLDLNEET